MGEEGVEIGHSRRIPDDESIRMTNGMQLPHS